MDTLFIVNPVAGKNKTLRNWKKIKTLADQTGLSYEVYFTRQPGDAANITRQRASLFKNAVVVGGDGTLSEVVNGVIGTNIQIGLIPSGTGNDFARSVGISRDITKAFHQWESGTPHRVDTVFYDSQVFINIAGTGIDAVVAEDVNQHSWKKRFGMGGYLISLLTQLLRFKPVEAEVTVDNKRYTFHNVWLVAIGNATSYGGGMRVLPQAKTDDGLIDICIVSDISLGRFLLVFPSVFRGNHVSDKCVQILRGKSVIIDTALPLPIHADGELTGATPFACRIHSQQVTLVY